MNIVSNTTFWVKLLYQPEAVSPIDWAANMKAWYIYYANIIMLRFVNVIILHYANIITLCNYVTNVITLS